MKRAIFLLLITVNSVWATQTPFRGGVNITEWFEAESADQIQFAKYTKQDFINIKSLGCDVIRVPINMHSMTSGSPGYTVDPLLFYFLDNVVDWAEDLDLHLILENDSLDPAVAADPSIVNVLVPVWTQMADHFKNRSNLVYYEILNEPHGISDVDWGNIQQSVIDAIRIVDQTHTIIVGPANFNSYENLVDLPWYSDNNLIYTFHFYDPILFTHQGADWTNPSLEPLKGMPFPYEPDSMPDLPNVLKTTWVSSTYYSYVIDGTARNVYSMIDIAVAFKKSREVPVFCGEFGVYKPVCDDIHRSFWYFMVSKYFEYNEISWANAGYKGGFGLFEEGTNELFDYDLNVLLVKLLGFYAPQQGYYFPMPEMTGFDIYTDYLGSNIYDTSSPAGVLDFYSQSSPAVGNYCIHWTDVLQYGKISFQFSPVKDLSVLVDDDYAVDFYVRSDNPAAKFDLRFLDTKTSDPDDHPWRMRYVIDNTVAVWDGNWNHLQIPLSIFTEQGSYDGGWFPPQGDFDWSAVEKFEIVTEYGDITGTGLYFDNIIITGP